MDATTPNDRLADVMAEAGLSRKALARAVREVATRAGHPVSCDHTAVGRWLAGTRPRERTAHFVADALSTRLSRTVRTSDIGLSVGSALTATFGTEYAVDVDQAAAVLVGLLEADQRGTRPVVDSPALPPAWSEASLSWLVRPGPDVMHERPAGVRVGVADIERLQATVSAFADMDDRFGGGHARQALVHYLGAEGPALLAGRYDERTGRRLHAAVAEACLLAAWMTYDAGTHGLAQRYFLQGLRLAQAADDVLLAGTILDAMSHQATFLGRSREAANLARAARQGTAASGSPTLTAHFHAMEARALAAGGDAVGAERALSEAVRVYDRRLPDSDPEFFTYFSEAEMAAEFSHCYRDTGRFADAVIYAKQGMTGSVRSDFFVTMVLATSQLGVGEVEQACLTARGALDLGAALRSARSVQYFAGFHNKLNSLTKTPAVRELGAYASDHPLWSASIRTTSPRH